jgi:hypothetical protein
VQSYEASPNYIAPLASNPAATGVTTDVTFGWTLPQVHHIMFQNNSATPVSFEFDQATTAGSPNIPAGVTFFFDVFCTTVHLQAAASVTINGNAAGNLVLRAWE